MSHLKAPEKALFFISCLYSSEKWKDDLIDFMTQNFGEFTTFKHSYFPMKEYYSKEMGQGLERLFFFFSRSIELSDLVSLKIKCDKLEKEHALGESRTINLDPGYISTSQVILATGKPYNHRIYLNSGVYGELCYQFEAKSFKTLPWTYPDYQHSEIIQAFNIARELNFFYKSL